MRPSETRARILSTSIVVAAGISLAGSATYTLAIFVDYRFLLDGPMFAIGCVICLSVVWFHFLRRRQRTTDCTPYCIAFLALPYLPLLLLSCVFIPHLLGNIWLVHGVHSPLLGVRLEHYTKLGLVIGAPLLASGFLFRLTSSLQSARSCSTQFLRIATALVVFVLAAWPALLHWVGLQVPPRAFRAQRELAVPSSVRTSDEVEYVWWQHATRDLDHLVQTPGFVFASEGGLSVDLPYVGDGRYRLKFEVASTSRRRVPFEFANSWAIEGGGSVKVLLTAKDGTKRQLVDEVVDAKAKTFDVNLTDVESGTAVDIMVVPDSSSTLLLHGLDAYRSTENPKQVLLISLDTHGMKHMRFADTEAFATNPSLAAVVEADRRFTSYSGGTAVSNWTLPSHATMFTGVYPSQHRIVDGSVSADGSVSIEFDPRIRLLTEMVGETGAKVLHLVSHIRIDERYGYFRGVDRMEKFAGDLGLRGRRVFERARALLVANSDRDVFMFVHVYDAHSPYDNFPQDYRNLQLAGSPHYPTEFYHGAQYSSLHEDSWHPEKRRSNRRMLSSDFAEEVEAAELAYQLGIRNVDEMLGDFLNDLKTAGLYDNTAMVVSSDHGEEFSDHGLLGQTSLYQENISVPFLVRLPETMYPLDPPELA